jgi:AcrR family transcriptional regulator
VIQGQVESTEVDEPSAGHRTPRRAGQGKKTQVLEAAGRVIADRGADATRFADVATESGMAVSTLQYYFGSREDLLVAAFRFASTKDISALEAELSTLTSPWDKLRRMIVRAVDCYRGEGEPGKIWVEAWHFGIRDAEMRAHTISDFAAWRRLLGECVREGFDAGMFARSCVPERIALLANSLVDGYGIPLALDDPDTNPDQAIEDILATLATLLGYPNRPDVATTTK